MNSSQGKLQGRVFPRMRRLEGATRDSFRTMVQAGINWVWVRRKPQGLWKHKPVSCVRDPTGHKLEK